MNTLVVDAPAKVNLFLRVLNGRDDGYHEIETLFQSVSLADEVRVTLVESAPPGERLEVVGADLGPEEENLAVRASRRFREVSGLEAEVQIGLLKRIPAGAGLGGGSSDAAAVLRCLALLNSFEDVDALHAIAGELGSDVPFFLEGAPLSYGQGRGEVLTPVSTLPEATLVLSLPAVHVSTPGAYAALAASREDAGETEGKGGRRRAPRRELGLDLTWPEVRALAENDFEPLIADMHPEVAASLEGLRAEGASVALLSGSGAATFGFFEKRAEAARAGRVLEERFGWRHVTVSTRTQPPTPRLLAEGG
jgi:4-diphosphocytidyl-2-C-methyl-D-erythritol kinase